MTTDASPDASTGDLVNEALNEARDLVRIEIKLAKDEMKKQLREAEGAALFFGAAGLFALVCLNLLAVAIVCAFGATAVAAILTAACFLVVSGFAALVGYWFLPKKALPKATEEAKQDVQQLKEAL